MQRRSAQLQRLADALHRRYSHPQRSVGEQVQHQSATRETARLARHTSTRFSPWFSRGWTEALERRDRWLVSAKGLGLHTHRRTCGVEGGPDIETGAEWSVGSC